MAIQDQGSASTGNATPQGSDGTIATRTTEQPAATSGNSDALSKEELLARLQNAEKSYNEYRSLTDKKLQDFSSKYKKLEGAILGAAKEKGGDTEEGGVDGLSDDTLSKLRKMHQKDPLMAQIAIVSAAMQSMKGSEDVVLKKIKEKEITREGVEKLNDPIAVKHEDEIRQVMYEYGMNPDHENSAKAAFDIWKGRNIETYVTEAQANRAASGNARPKGESTMDSHSQGAERNATGRENLSDVDREIVKIAVDRGVFKDESDFMSFKKTLDGVPKTSDGKFHGVVIDDIPQKKSGG